MPQTLTAYDIKTAAAGTIAPNDTAAEGAARTMARSDHTHAITAAAPSDVGAANSEGSATSFARSDHVHAIGAAVVTHAKLEEQVERQVDVTVSSAELLALNATPKTLVAAPGANKALVFEGAVLFLDFNTTAYGGIAAGEDLSVKYTDGSGAEVAQCETTGFLDATADAVRYVRPQAAATGPSQITPAANAALVLQMLVGEIITGNSPLKVRVYYRTVPTTLA